MKLRQSASAKQKLSTTLRNWLPLLSSSLQNLEEELKPFAEANPLVSVKSGFEEEFSKKFNKRVLSGDVKNSQSEKIEALSVKKDSLFEVLDGQIGAPLFPTPKSCDIAFEIVANLDECGFFEGNFEEISKKLNVSIEDIERVRKRFSNLEPAGIGALDVRESFIFQLDQSDVSDDIYSLAFKMIEDLELMHQYKNDTYYEDSIKTIQSFKNPPAIDYFEDSKEVIPDLLIFQDENGSIDVNINDAFYPSIKIDTEYGVEHEYVKDKIKEAKGLVDALDMRKATLYKIGLMIVEYQYEFFTGGNIMPLTLKVLADEFGHNPSTISRAISSKYIACDRGVFSMKEFFTTAIDEDVSNAAIKDYLSTLVKNENFKKPYSDMKFLDMIQEKFKVKMVRRTIAKYRKQLNIAGSSERKKLYMMRYGS